MDSSARPSRDSWTLIGHKHGNSRIEAPVHGSRRMSSAECAWQPTDIPGFWIKFLYEDTARGEKTMLMKLDPGAFAPSHTHDQEFEQVFVLEGSFYDQDGIMVAGDCCCRAPDTAHTAGSAEGALVMLIYTRRELIKACIQIGDASSS